MSINAILFDLDGTLLDRDLSLQSFIRDQYDRISAFHVIEKETFVSRFIELDHHGYVWKDKVYQQLLRDFFIQDVHWAFLLNDYVNHFHHHCIAYPELLSMLTRLKTYDIKLALVSNGFGEFQYNNFKALHIDHLFDTVLISEWEGLRKPDPAIFVRALDKLGVSAKQALYVGDHPENDIRASRNVGMKACWKRNQQCETVVEADAVIDNLGELARIVDVLCNSAE